MGRKVFMSVLGTGFYDECTYVGSRTKTTTRFIQVATLKDIGADAWTENDAVFVFLTDKAKTSNWNRSITERQNRDKEMVPYSGLEEELDRMGLKCESVDIKDGKDEAEMWEVFNAIYSRLEEGDELYFDLTHAFRYLPMLLLVMGNYAKFLKNVKTAYLGYGNYDGRKKNVEGHPELDEAPIMDLLPLSVLQDWTFAAGQFLQSGKADGICALGSGRCAEIKRQINGKNEGVDSLNAFVKTLKTVSDNLILCRGVKVIDGGDIANMRKYEKQLNDDAIPAFAPLIAKITNSLSSFSGTRNVYNSYCAAKWCLDKGLHQQTITFLRESVVSIFCEKYGLDVTDEKARAIVDRAFTFNNPERKEPIMDIDCELKPIFNKVSADPLFKDNDFVLSVEHLRNLRNDINHSGMRKGPFEVKKIHKQINAAVGKLDQYFGDTYSACHTSIFINYSNHSSEKWCDIQKAEARKFGDVIDLKFPVIDPDLSEDGIDKLAEIELGKILGLACGKDATVHIMGEQTLSFVLINKLKAQGIRCVASTTERVVKELDDKTRVVEFNFVRFREY